MCFQFPMSMYMITGSQASQADKNKLTLLKLTELHKTQAPQGMQSNIHFYISYLHQTMMKVWMKTKLWMRILR